MKSVYEIVKHLEATPGKNDKLAYLKENANDDIKEFFYLALEPSVLFYIKKIPAYKPLSKGCVHLMDAAYQLNDKIATRYLTGRAAIDFVADLLCRLTTEDAEMLERIILKDARVGMSEKTINKVWPGLCTEKLYMRCASFNEKNLNKVNYPALVQLKADGLFINVIVRPEHDQVTYLSRNMKPIEFHGCLDKAVLDMDISEPTVIHGEGLVLKKDGSGYEDRKTGNGIINKAIKGTISKEEASRVVLKVWDMMPLGDWKAKKCDIPYETRLRALEKARYSKSCLFLPVSSKKKIRIIPTKMIKSLEDAYLFFNRMLNKGHEGAILKNRTGIWKNHTSPNCVKMKVKDPADLLCTGILPFDKDTIMRGDKVIDTSNWIGSLMLESSDGKIKVNSGSGLDDKLRALPPEHFIGHIWEIEYNEIITSKSKSTSSLFLPIVKEKRLDKNEADSYELIVERSKGRCRRPGPNQSQQKK